MALPSDSLWRNREFLRLWSAQGVSVFGSELASLAYPLTAIVVLQAGVFETSVLQAAGGAAAFTVGLFVGVIADRVRRKPLLIVSDLGRAGLAFTIPVAAFFGVLRIEQLYVVAFLAGALNILWLVAAMALTPSLVEKEQLVESNSKMSTTESVAMIAGPGISGVLLQVVTAPLAIVCDAASFLVSAALIWRIRAPEVLSEKEPRSVWTEIGEGLRFVYRHPILRPLAESIALYFFFRQLVLALFLLYAVRVLDLEPFFLGVIFSGLGFGFLCGALTVRRITVRFGIGRTMIFANLLNIFSLALVPLAAGSKLPVVSLLAVSHFLHAFGVQINGINLVSLRQSITPNDLQGRMTASFRFVNVGMIALGALIAGGLGEWIGLRATLVIGVAGMILPFLRLVFSPVRNFSGLTE
ncbi:MAG TPA: MFS transporter [Pyrinomonadaceae bacterium]|jgi:MFS family permease